MASGLARLPESVSLRQPSVGVRSVEWDCHPLFRGDNHHPPERIGEQSADSASDLESACFAGDHEERSAPEDRDTDLCPEQHLPIPVLFAF